MAYANPRKLRRTKAQEVLTQARLAGTGAVTAVEHGNEEFAFKRAKEAATLYRKAVALYPSVRL